MYRNSSVNVNMVKPDQCSAADRDHAGLCRCHVLESFLHQTWFL